MGTSALPLLRHPGRAAVISHNGTTCGCARIFRWPTRNSQLWKMDLPRTKNYSKSWPPYRRQQDRLPGSSAERISYNCTPCEQPHDPTVGRSFATFGGILKVSLHFCGDSVPQLTAEGFSDLEFRLLASRLSTCRQNRSCPKQFGSLRVPTLANLHELYIIPFCGFWLSCRFCSESSTGERIKTIRVKTQL